ncbi:hypothetical protein BpHYR1_050794 [Brachionus plicatilis]|uniref:Uncharacterized protein n=1 Tax=Brachionus plicatilis TaxID=10195 RepID=A0A3M7Q885_BRAPC|nr:hypothetical protein BpHYR1_050794 [Brachionus plicatilis]
MSKILHPPRIKEKINKFSILCVFVPVDRLSLLLASFTALDSSLSFMPLSSAFLLFESLVSSFPKAFRNIDLSLSGDSIASSDSENEEDETFYEALTVELDKLSVATNELELTKTNRDGLKLCSLGLYYTKERTTKRENKTHSRCERTSKCIGQAHTIGFDPPVL